MVHWWERSPPTDVAWVRFQSGAVCGLSLLLVLALLRGFHFSPGSMVFLPSQKPTCSKFQIDHDRGAACKTTNAELVSFLNIAILYVKPRLSVNVFNHVSTSDEYSHSYLCKIVANEKEIVAKYSMQFLDWTARADNKLKFHTVLFISVTDGFWDQV